MLKINSVLLVIVAGLFLGMTGSAIAQVDKKDLESRVQAVLSPYSMHHLSVSADEKGAVTIKGTVDAFYDKLDIYQRVSSVNGVTKINDLVAFDIPLVPDDMIKANIIRTIKDNSIILEPDKITVAVTDGLVILDGTVSYYKEKLMATTIASWQDGVKGVENRITVLPSPEKKSDENIKSVLEEILKNRFRLIRNTVSIKVANGNVALDGKVQTLWEKSQLKEEFLQVPGVKSVVENLKVQPS